MYDPRISQQEQVSGFGMVRDLAATAANPINWYRYNPTMFNAHRGQIRMPFSQMGMAKWANRIRHIPGGNWLVDKLKMTGVQTIGGPLGTKEVWVGSAAWKDTEHLFRSRYVMQNKDYMTAAKYTGTRALTVVPGAAKDASLAESILNVSPGDQTALAIIPGKGAVHAPQVPRSFKNKLLGYDPAFKYQQPNFTLDPQFGTRVGLSRAPLEGVDLNAARNAALKKASAAKGLAGRSSITKGYDWAVKGMKGWNWKGTGMGLGKLGMRVGATALKTSAYLGLAGIMWDTANYLFEPLGRATMQKFEQSFQEYERIRTPELGGRISMEYLTIGAATERQRALEAISKSRLNARSGFGAEARNIHQ